MNSIDNMKCIGNHTNNPSIVSGYTQLLLTFAN